MWQEKAKRIIADECAASYRAANKGRKRHVAYRVPEIAAALIEALNKDDEHEAKRLFLVHSTGALSLI
jgi:hypothetical protein